MNQNGIFRYNTNIVTKPPWMLLLKGDIGYELFLYGVFITNSGSWAVIEVTFPNSGQRQGASPTTATLEFQMAKLPESHPECFGLYGHEKWTWSWAAKRSRLFCYHGNDLILTSSLTAWLGMQSVCSRGLFLGHLGKVVLVFKEVYLTWTHQFTVLL